VGFVRQTPGAKLEPNGRLRFPATGAGGEWLKELRRRLLGLEG
jgi:hypothetical protein